MNQLLWEDWVSQAWTLFQFRVVRPCIEGQLQCPAKLASQNVLRTICDWLSTASSNTLQSLFGIFTRPKRIARAIGSSSQVLNSLPSFVLVVLPILPLAFHDPAPPSPRQLARGFAKCRQLCGLAALSDGAMGSVSCFLISLMQ